MVSQTVTVMNRLGLHARPAGIFCKECAKADCKVQIKRGDKTIDAKSILGVLTLAAKCGTEIELICDGENEAETLKHLAEFLETGLPD